jgi:quinohemoprotein ethanol dehydrogenase
METCMKKRLPVAPVLLAIAAAFAPGMTTGAAATPDCCSPTGADWPKNGGNYGNQMSTSLEQVNKGNVRSLGPAWVVQTNDEPITQPVPGPGGGRMGSQTTPIVVDGVMYSDTAAGGVIAVDAATGNVKWKWQPSNASAGFDPQASRRGVSVGEGKVYTISGGSRVVALDKDTGAMVWARQPAVDAGVTLGTTAKVATIYYDGLVYIGTNDSSRSAAYAVRASDGAIQWWFYGAYPHGTSFTDVNGKTFDAGSSWDPIPNNCYLNGGYSPWIHPAIDPELKTVYWTFGNARSCVNSQDGSSREGDNLFANSVVAMDAKTGAYKWHFQSVRHDIWDMDNVHAPLLANVRINGELKKVIYYGSKSNHVFTLDRTNGKPALPIEMRTVPTDSRQKQPTQQPFPAAGPYMPQCLAFQNLGSEVPGLPNRAVPNWNGMQAEPDPAKPGQLKLARRPGNYLEADAPYLSGPERLGCMYDTHWAGPVLSMTSQNGGADWSNYAYSQKLSMYYVPYSYNPVGHANNLFQGGNGLRAIGQYQSGGIAAVDASTGKVVWRKEFGPGGDVAHGNSPLVTASGLLFIGRVDGYLLAMDAQTGEELWRFQTGFPSASGVIAYTVDGEQYIATAAMGGNQPYSQAGNGQALWAFKLGGNALYHTGPRSNPNYVSGSSEAPNPPPIANLRRPANNTSGAGLPPNTIYLARSNATASADKDSVSTGSMLPSQLHVPVGTTVTFTNPGDQHFGGVPNTGNLKEHCATQFFEGKFNFRLQPGQSAQYTFGREGEYFYNDCTDPRPTGKVIVTAPVQEMPGALRFSEAALDLRPADGVFTSVKGAVIAMFTVPAGYALDGDVKLTVPLSTQTFPAVATEIIGGGRTLKATFDKGLIDSNIPAGTAVPLAMTATFLHGGVQKKLTSTTTVTVLK